jgi:hypothetical protein
MVAGVDGIVAAVHDESCNPSDDEEELTVVDDDVE